jgi:hypothetical protein
MAARFLPGRRGVFDLDEHFPHAYRQALSRADATIDVWMIGEPGGRPHGASDPEILRWCESERAMLLTNDRRTMPGHLARISPTAGASWDCSPSILPVTGRASSTISC